MNHAQPTRQPAVNPSSSLHAALALGLSLCITAPGLCGEPSPGKLYYINQTCRTIYRMDLADPDPQPVDFITPSNRYTLAVHDCKMYWTETELDQIQRTNMDGSGLETVIQNLGDPQGIAIDPVADKLYFTTAFNGENAIIRKSNLDGSNAEVVMPLSAEFASIALDVGGGKMYLLQRLSTGAYGISRANLDGSNIEPVVEASSHVGPFSLDLSAGHIYWREWYSGYNTDLIRRANLDGSNPQNILTGIEGGPIAVDPTLGKVYWGDHDAKVIWRANLDGSQIEQLTPYGTCSPAGFFIAYGDVDAVCGPHDPCPPKVDCEAVEKIYWTDTGNPPLDPARIWRANPDGTGAEIALTLSPHPIDVFSLAIDKAGGKAYFTTPAHCPCAALPQCFPCLSCDASCSGCNATHVWRANLNGSSNEPEPLVELFQECGSGKVVYNIALDLSAGRMYFLRQRHPTPSQTTMYRANLDGTQVQEIYTATIGMGPMFIDSAQQKIYFGRPNKIVRADLSTVPLVPQDVIVESLQVKPVAVDFEAGKIYYLLNTDNSFPECTLGPSPLAKRANLDGSNIETLGVHANLLWCQSSAEVLDVASMRLYRVPGTDPGGGNCGILRSNFADGSERFCTMFKTGSGFGGAVLVMRDVVPGDITGDGIVNVNDLLAVVGTWGPCPAPPAPCPTDIAPAPNGDGVVGVNDLLMVIGNWS